MLKAIVAFKKAIADIDLKKAIAELKFGNFLIFRFFFDALGLSDSESKSIGKTLDNSSITSDLALKGLSKASNDGFSASDATSLDVGTSLIDSGAISDEIDTFAVGKGLNDSSSTNDETAFAIGTTRTDAFSVSESISNAPNKVLANSSATADVKTLSLSKALADFYAVGDSHRSSFTKSNADSSAFSDTQRKDFYKVITEAAGVTDDLDGEATTNDDQDMTFVKVRSNLATITDVVSIVKNTIFSDTSALTDSGLVRNQGYCDFSYFEADYVGDSRTF